MKKLLVAVLMFISMIIPLRTEAVSVQGLDIYAFSDGRIEYHINTVISAGLGAKNMHVYLTPYLLDPRDVVAKSAVIKSFVFVEGSDGWIYGTSFLNETSTWPSDPVSSNSYAQAVFNIAYPMWEREYPKEIEELNRRRAKAEAAQIEREKQKVIDAKNREHAIDVLERADDLFDQKKYSEASTLYGEALKYLSDVGDIYYKLGMINGDIYYFDKAIQYEPNHGPAHAERAKFYRSMAQKAQWSSDPSERKRKNDYTTQAYYDEKAGSSPGGKNYRKTEHIHKHRNANKIVNEFFKEGKALFESGKYDEAIQKYNEVIARKSDSSKAYFAIGYAYHEKGDTKNAIKAYKKAVSLNKKADGAHNNLGNIYYDAKDYKKAEEHYNKAISINPQNKRAFIGLGNTYKALNKYEQAITAYETGISLGRENAAIWKNLSDIYYDKGNYQKALEGYNKSISLGGADASVYVRLGDSYSKTGDNQKAIEAYEQAVSMGYIIDNKLGDEAIKAYQKAVDDNPTDYQRIYMLAFMYENSNPEKATELYKKALELQPDDYRNYEGIAMCCMNLKKYEEAIDAWTKVINMEPKNSMFDTNYYFRGQCYEKLKKYNEALQDYKKAMELRPHTEAKEAIERVSKHVS